MTWSGSAPQGAELSNSPGLRSVLVVDDDADAREMLALVLTLAGHTVRTASDGVEALTVAEAFFPDVIFLDIEMPKANGYTACQNLRRSHSLHDVRIYAVSGVTGAAHDRRCNEVGFDGQLSKPADAGSFHRLV
jgi:CheY-like chemotaxis protein